MEPVSTVALAVAMLAANPATRKSIWDTEPASSSRLFFTSVDTTFQLPGNIIPAQTQLLIETNIPPTALAISHRELLKREVNAYLELSAGWNGEDAIPPSHAALDAALKSIDAIPARLPLPRPMLSSSGEVALYWDLQGGYAELSFEHDGSACFFSRSEAGTEEFLEIADLSILNNGWFYEKIGPMDYPLKAAA